MISGFNTDTTQIITNGLDSVNWPTIEKTKKITLYRVLQELLVNMKNIVIVVWSCYLNLNETRSTSITLIMALASLLIK
jgi:hypothetical protein